MWLVIGIIALVVIGVMLIVISAVISGTILDREDDDKAQREWLDNHMKERESGKRKQK